MSTTPAPGIAGFGASTDRARGDLLEALRRGRKRLMIAGVLMLVLGLVAIIVPAVASVATAIFIGWILVIASAFDFANAMAVEHGGRKALRFVLALITFIAGIYLLVAPLDGVFTLTVVLVIWFMATGTARVIVGIAERGLPGWGMTVLSGAISIVLGVLIAEQLPSSADWAIGLIVGVDLLFSGSLLTSLAYRLRDLPLIRS
jgi:uncharacterized membrane protein HdeD (DUF308 family)